MKVFSLYLLLGVSLWAEPIWVPKGYPVPTGLMRKGPIPQTGSMRPTIRGGEFCWVEYPPFKTPLKIKDVVGALTPQGPRLHRIIAMNSRAIYTSGDANREADGWVLNQDVIYVVRYIERPEVSPYSQVH